MHKEQRPLAIFRTPAEHVLGEVFMGLIGGGVIVVVGLSASLGCAAALLSLPALPVPAGREPIAMVGIAVLPFLWFCLVAWRMASSRWRFTLRLFESELCFGTGPFAAHQQLTSALP